MCVNTNVIVSITRHHPPREQVNPWSLHVTANDAYKASFTLEDGTAYFRVVDEHDIVDKHP